MKHVNFFQSPNVKKWGLAGCLLVALGANLSFNPDSKVIARNDGFTSGEYSFASTTCDADAKPKKLDDIKLTDKYKGLTVEAYCTKDKNNIRYIIKKAESEATETQAETCFNCANLAPKTVTIDPDDAENIVFLQSAIKAHAIAQLEKIKQEDKKKDVKEEKKDKVKIEELAFDAEKCDRPGRKDIEEDSSILSEYVTCQTHRLNELDRQCDKTVDQKIAEAKSKKKSDDSEDSDTIEKQVRASCKRTADRIYNREIRPFMNSALSERANAQIIYNPRTMKWESFLKHSLTSQAALSLINSLKDFKGSIVSMQTSKLIDSDLRRGIGQSISATHDFVFDEIKNSLMANGFDLGNADKMAHMQSNIALKKYIDSYGPNIQYLLAQSRSATSATGDKDYLLNYQKEVLNPYRELTLGQNGQSGLTARMAQDVSMNPNDLITRFINATIDGSFPSTQSGQPPQPGQLGRQGGSTGGVRILPGRPPIGAGFSSTNSQGGTPVRQQTQGLSVPQTQSQPSLRQGGALPGPRIGL